MQQYYIAIIAVWSLFGNLRGTFYLDDVRLVAARIDGATAVREEREEGVPDVGQAGGADEGGHRAKILTR